MVQNFSPQDLKIFGEITATKNADETNHQVSCLIEKKFMTTHIIY